jgi:ferredoxin-NADP reductase
MSRHPAVITRIARETPTILSFSVRPLDGGYRYLAGQWAELRTMDEGREIMGGYSMTSSPTTSATLDFAVKASRKHDFTRWLHERARVGDALTLGPAMGTFVFEAGMADELVLIGGGVGVTPLIGILRHVLDSGLAVPISSQSPGRPKIELAPRGGLSEAKSRGKESSQSPGRPKIELAPRGELSEAKSRGKESSQSPGRPKIDLAPRGGLSEAKSRGKLTLIYSMAAPEEYLFRAELEATARDHPNLHLVPIVTGSEVGDWRGRRGRIEAKLLGKHLGGAGALYYLCGPPGMVEDMIRLLGSLGVPERQVVYEKWW